MPNNLLIRTHNRANLGMLFQNKQIALINKTGDNMSNKLKALITGCFMLIVSFAQAASWPSKPIELVVAFAPGGNTDMIARILSEQLSQELGQTVLVVNKPGATGLIGTKYVVDSKPDGYTYLVNVTGLVISPHVLKSVPEDLPFQLKAVSQISSIPKAMVVNTDFPANSFDEFIEEAKNKTLSYGSSGIGSGNHLTGELVSMITGEPMTHVTYRGSSPAILDLLGGRIDMVFDDLPVVLPFINDNKLKAIVTLSEERNPLIPEVPSVGELGLDELVIEPWNGVLAPLNVDSKIIKAMDSAIEKVVKSQEFIDQMEERGLKAAYLNSDEYSRFIEQEYERWGSVVKNAGIQRQ